MLKSAHRCKCMCHTNKDVSHCISCCSVCPNCNENIIKPYYTEHLKECLSEEEKNIEYILNKNLWGKSGKYEKNLDK